MYIRFFSDVNEKSEQGALFPAKHALIAVRGRAPHIKAMTFWQFLIFLLLSVFVLWNIWHAIRSLGDLGDKD